MIIYTEEKKFADFNGLHFCRDDKTGYYLNSNTSTRLHRCVWEYYNGKIPEGYEIHHIDHDKGNNEIENLAMLTEEEHHRIHAKEKTDEELQKLRENIVKTAIPAAVQWHKSKAGSVWHKAHYESMKNALHERKQRVCKQCGQPFMGTLNEKNVFCSNACKSAWRRESGIDNEQRICQYCKSAFTTNKYANRKYCSAECRRSYRLENKKNSEIKARASLQHGSCKIS